MDSTQTIQFVFADSLDSLASGKFPAGVLIPGRTVVLTKDDMTFDFEIVDVRGDSVLVWPVSRGGVC